MDDASKALQQFLHERGLRVTPQRLAIASVVHGGHGHVGADEVYRRARLRLPSLSRATVYNTLQFLVRHGILRELVIREGRVLYDANLSSHHHFICEETGQVFDVPGDLVRGMRFPALEDRFEVSQYAIVFRGRVKGQTGGKRYANSRAGSGK